MQVKRLRNPTWWSFAPSLESPLVAQGLTGAGVVGLGRNHGEALAQLHEGEVLNEHTFVIECQPQ